MDSHCPKHSLGGQEERAQSSSPLPILCLPAPALLSLSDQPQTPSPAGHSLACPQREVAQCLAPLPAAVPVGMHAQGAVGTACSAAEKRAEKGYGCLLIMLGPNPGCQVPLLTPGTAHVHPPSAPLISPTPWTRFSTQPSGLTLHRAPEEGHSLSPLAWLAVKGKPCPRVFQTPLSQQPSVGWLLAPGSFPQARQ